MPKASSTAIKITLVMTAVLLVAWWAYKRVQQAPIDTTLAAADRTKDSTQTIRPTAAITNAALPTLTTTGFPAATAVAVKTPPTFAEALTKLSPAEVDFVKAANNRLYGALDYHSIRELQWKLERGFPSMEEVLALRGQPVPPVLTNEQYSQLTLQQTIKHFLQWTLAEQGRPGSDKEMDAVWMVRMSKITRALDTPFPAYLRASMADPRTAGGQANLMHQAMTAAAYGDSQLASEVVVRLNEIDRDSPYVSSLHRIGAVASFVAIDQVNACFDRYTGNPRTAETLRQSAERHRAQANCSQP
jgi:hypothetical protein